MRSVAEINGIDPEVVKLCDAMNAMPGIRTHESCCGHGCGGFRIYFRADSFDELAQLSYAIDGCHSGIYGWTIEVWTDCAAELSLVLKSESEGKLAIVQSEVLAANIRGDMDEWRVLFGKECEMLLAARNA